MQSVSMRIASVLALDLLVACQVAQTALGQSSRALVLSKSCSDMGISKGTDFVAKKVCYLDPSFSAANNGGSGESPTRGGYGTYSPPACNGVPPSTSREAVVLATAWNAAPSGLQKKMCSLQWLFVEQESPLNQNMSSWGFWENPDYQESTWNGTTGQSAYISIPSAYLTYNGSLADLDNKFLFGGLLPGVSSANWAGAGYSQSQSNNVPYPALSVIAHEMGHIVWLDSSVSTQSCAANTFNKSWNTHAAKHFTKFGDSDANINDDGDKSDLDAIDGYLQNNDPKNANKGVDKRLKKRQWASLFATISPVEDFVETYKMGVLYNAQTVTDPGTSTSFGSLTSYVFTLGSPDTTTSYDLMGDLKTSGTKLNDKYACALTF